MFAAIVLIGVLGAVAFGAQRRHLRQRERQKEVLLEVRDAGFAMADTT